ncbi:MAG: 50S ribosomal protein L35 [Armatimonadetes bacterium]|nr:50S ribosomal protein L35 [Armatimonadota bacterium]
MPKMKTRKTAAKRFKITANGKLMHRCSNRNHLQMKKTKGRKRRLDWDTQVPAAHRKMMERMIAAV